MVGVDVIPAARAAQMVCTQSGTPPYQSPDITAGIDRWAPSSDLFAVGVVLYELLCYTHPYEDAQPRMDRVPQDPRKYREELSPDLAEYLTKACAPWHGQRFATATEMRGALRAISRLTISRAVAQRVTRSNHLKQLT